MKYLKVTNTPLKVLAKNKYFSYNGQIAWEACGFNPIIVSMKSIQYVDEGQNMVQYIPISDETKFDSIWEDLQHESTPLGEECSMEVIDDVDGSLYSQWKIDAGRG